MKTSHIYTHQPAHLAAKHCLVNKGIQLECWIRLMIFLSCINQHLHPPTPCSKIQYTHIHTPPLTCRFCLHQVCIIYVWSVLKRLSQRRQRKIRLNSFLGPLTVNPVIQCWLSDYFSGPQRKWINGKTSFYIEWLITREEHGLGR